MIDKVTVEYLLVDGYNIIHAWPELKELAEDYLEHSSFSRYNCLDGEDEKKIR
ncbi:NYN domain-containing protein [Natranaerovirga hydrolytica]|uniref:NYN domain-containing protein n=1 Tax=Natranaerovirga hydrolytica TaxID=680378 RepID=UPI001FAA3411|nr:NYN domain-containing protein [Natranaerovirga hydrolytica]